jgi:hypothetical protein
MSSKDDYTQLYNQIQGYQNSIEGDRTDWQNQRRAISGYKQQLEDARNAPQVDANSARTALEGNVGDIGTARGAYANMLANPGYDQATQNNMLGVQSDALSGARTGFMKGMGQMAAAQGMGGSTGASMRNMMNYDQGYAANQRAAARDVYLANAQQSKADIAAGGAGMLNVGNAMRDTSTGYQNLQNSQNQYQLQNLGMQGETLNQNANALQGELGVQQTVAGLYGNQAQNLAQKDKPGFWGTLGNAFAGQLGKTLGGGGVSYQIH